jgi:hypothetical protein
MRGGGDFLIAAMRPDSVWPDLSPEITQSKLYTHGGVLLLADLLGTQTIEQLESEAALVRAGAMRTEYTAGDVKEERGGSPSRSFAAAHARHVQWSIFSSPALLKALCAVCGLDAVPTGGGSYSYYERPGDYLALHRDILTCDLTVITCLRDIVSPKGGGLLVYPEHINLPLEWARQAGRSAGLTVTIRPGESAALLGGVVPHEVTPVLPGQERVVSVMCYRVQGLS